MSNTFKLTSLPPKSLQISHQYRPGSITNPLRYPGFITSAIYNIIASHSILSSLFHINLYNFFVSEHRKM